ncbi:MAG: hypothetical protein VR74_00765 [Hyphomonas sp. BRH_c22]|uniref:hypothetical protein n=1 Tax=Hyphomonas sp. BRH_c22 TaxID=1629710 RepID=UPI0005F253A8|nr:hypothetical protein [Hyphomonas sp. BRH_c22]KJS39747.1 MAG: hypothetical protein VR74_00765 [Hyphomonas sp. BRH_c22]
MQFKRWRLSAASPLVNAGVGLALLFTASACSKQDKQADSGAEAPVIAAGTVLPAVWSTRPLEGEVASIALSGGLRGILAVAYEKGGLQFYDMEAEKLGEKSNFRLKSLAGGQSSVVEERSITVFPGITRDGELKAYIYGEGLIAPAQIDLPVNADKAIGGVCSGPAPGTGLMRLAFWTETNNRVLQNGIIREADGELAWTAGTSTFTDFPVKSCAFTSDTLVASPRASSAASLVRGPLDALVSLEDGKLGISTDLGMTNAEISVKDGITVVAPDTPVALAAMGTMMSGGYPGGLIVIAGETRPGEHHAVFVDPSPLTLSTN